MKNIVYTLILTALLPLLVNAQLENGSSYPTNIAGTDFITSETIDVQDWLDDDKSVIVSFFTTYCEKCWEHYQSNSLINLYNDFGPQGTDELRIVAIEVEADNSSSHLTMPVNNLAPDKSLGDWTDGIPYPILDDDSFNLPFKIELTPLIYIIRPNGIMIELNINEAIYNENFQLRALFPKTSDIIINSDLFDATFCDDYDIPENNLSILNMGSEPIENFKVDYYIGQTQVQSTPYNQTINPLSESFIVVDEQTVFSNAEVNIFISEINSEPYPIDNFNQITSDIIKPVLNTAKLKMKITFDEHPHETKWTILTDTGVEIDQKSLHRWRSGIIRKC